MLPARRTITTLARRPFLWPTGLRQAGRMAPRGWWRRPPFLPVPDPDYLRFRLETQYGRDVEVEPDDVVTYLEWCRDQHRRVRTRR